MEKALIGLRVDGAVRIEREIRTTAGIAPNDGWCWLSLFLGLGFNRRRARLL